MTDKIEIATFGAGCFWSVEARFRELKGVLDATSGYMGGQLPDPGYEAVCSGSTGHAEVVQVRFDTRQVSFETLLALFFDMHNPTTMNRQGNDMGLSYRSAIYYVDEAQKDEALNTIADVEASGLWPGKVVTEVEPAGDFWQAEPEHQDYLQRLPNGYTCHFVRPDWVLPKRG